MSAKAEAWAWKIDVTSFESLIWIDKFVLLTLAHCHCAYEDCCQVSIKELSTLTALDLNSIRVALFKLHQCELITIIVHMVHDEKEPEYKLNFHKIS